MFFNVYQINASPPKNFFNGSVFFYLTFFNKVFFLIACDLHVTLLCKYSNHIVFITIKQVEMSTCNLHITCLFELINTYTHVLHVV